MSALRIYRNTRTGTCIQTPCECAGEDWEEVKPSSPCSGRSGQRSGTDTEEDHQESEVMCHGCLCDC